MAQIEYTADEQALIAQHSYTPPLQEYEQNKFVSLAESVNATVALSKRGEYEKKTYDTTQYSSTPFTRESMRKELEAKTLSPNVRNNVMSQHITDWNDFEQKVNYLKHFEESQKQVAENFSTGSSLLIGGAFALLDPTDIFSVIPILSGANKLKKTMEAGASLPKTAVNVGAGAGVAAGSMLTYEASTGVYNDNSLVTSALLGAAIGGSLGFLLDKSTKLSPSYSDNQGNILAKEEAINTEYASAVKSANELDEVIGELQGVVQKQKEAELNLKETQDVSKKLATEEARKTKGKLKESWDRLSNLVKTTSDSIKPVRGAVDTYTAQITKLENSILKAEKQGNALKLETAARIELAKKVAPLKGQITKLTKQLEALKASRTKEANAKRKTLKEKLATKETQLLKATVALERNDKKISKLPSNPEEIISTSAKERGTLLKQRDRADASLQRLLKERSDYETQRKEATKKYDDYKIKESVANNPLGNYASKELREKLSAYGVSLSEEGIRALLKQKKINSEDLVKLAEGDLNISSLKALQKINHNIVEKLDKELNIFDLTKDFRTTGAFKQLPEWGKKLLISNVEVNLNSNNPLVAGLTSYLHSGTIFHGKVTTATAWILRTILDDRVKRLHSALTNSYKEAVKNGYTGKLIEFEEEVALNSYRVIGQIQRDLFTGMDGAIIGKKRFLQAEAKLGSIPRTHFSDNKWIVKATDDYLDYYEGIHKYGKNLDMDAFRGSLGKGYIKRVYSEAGINKVGGKEDAIKLLYDAQKAFAIATNSEITNAILAEFKVKAETAITSALDKRARYKAITKPLGVPVQSTESSLKQRGIDVFDDDIMDLLETDVRGTSYLYGLNTHGRIALKEKLGVDNDTQIEALIASTNPKPNELDNFRVMIDTIKGTREISSDPFNPVTRATKMASSYSSAMHQLAFGLTTTTEIAAIAKDFGWSKTISKFIETPQEIYRAYRYGTPSEKNTIEMMISYGDANFAHKSNRFSEDSFLDSYGKGQEFLDKVNAKFSVFSGMLPLTDMLRMTTASLAVDFLANLSVASKISKTDLMRLNDMGFDASDLERIRKTLQVQADGRIGNPNRKTWGTLDRDITTSVQTTVERTILNPNGITLPKFMSDMNTGQIVPRIVMKFMRFPFESYERMLIRGIQEADAKQLGGLMGNVGMWTIILAAKDAIKAPDDQKYSDSDGWNNLMLDSLLLNSFTTLPVSLIDTGVGVLTGETATGYRYSPLSVVGKDADNLFRKGNPKLSVPFTTLNIGDGVNKVVQDLFGLEIANEE